VLHAKIGAIASLYLKATCGNGVGWVSAQLDLNTCLANSNGELWVSIYILLTALVL
jgi:hypothetical protein